MPFGNAVDPLGCTQPFPRPKNDRPVDPAAVRRRCRRAQRATVDLIDEHIGPPPGVRIPQRLGPLLTSGQGVMSGCGKDRLPTDRCMHRRQCSSCRWSVIPAERVGLQLGRTEELPGAAGCRLLPAGAGAGAEPHHRPPPGRARPATGRSCLPPALPGGCRVEGDDDRGVREGDGMSRDAHPRDRFQDLLDRHR